MSNIDRIALLEHQIKYMSGQLQQLEQIHQVLGSWMVMNARYLAGVIQFPTEVKKSEETVEAAKEEVKDVVSTAGEEKKEGVEGK